MERIQKGEMGNMYVLNKYAAVEKNINEYRLTFAVGAALGSTVGVFVVGLFVGLPGSTVGNIVGVALGSAVVGRGVGLCDGEGVGIAVLVTVSTITPPTRADVGAIVGITSSSPGAPLGLLS